jgi:DNA-binding transcriptional regulator YiaG
MAKYKTEMKKAIHQDAAMLHKAGLLSDEEMRRFDEGCLVKPAAPVPRVSTQEPMAARSRAPVYARGK